MPIVIFRERGEALYAYIAKQDLEARVLQVEHDETDRCYYVNPQPGRPVFPISLRATRSTLL